MEESNKVMSTVWTIIVLLLLGWGLYYLVTHNKNDVVVTPPAGSDYYVSVVQLKHQYKDGEHVYAGTLDLPNACYTLNSRAEVGDATHTLITLDTLMNTEEMCAQVITSRDFRISVEGGDEMNVEGVLNDMAIEFNIFEVPENQDIDNFEINIKG